MSEATPVRTYFRLTEYCDWEGETWHVYVPLEGSEAALAALRALAEADPEVWKVGEDLLDEAAVRALESAPSGTDYLAEHAALDGPVVLPEVGPEELGYLLYKGQVRSFVVRDAPAGQAGG